MGASSSVAGSTTTTASHGSIDTDNNTLEDPSTTNHGSIDTHKNKKDQGPSNDQSNDTDSPSDFDRREKLKLEHPELKNQYEYFEDVTDRLKSSLTNDELEELSDQLDEFNYILYAHNGKPTYSSLGDYVALINFAEISVTKYLGILKAGNIDHVTDEMLEGANDGNLPVVFLDTVRGVFQNLTHSSFIFSDRLAETGFFYHLVKDVIRLYAEPQVQEANSSVFETAISVLTNSGKSPSTEIRQHFRDADAVKQLVTLLQTEYPYAKLRALLCLANIITEEENDLLFAADEMIFDDIIQMIKVANKSATHHYPMPHFNVTELLAGLKRLGRNDKNSIILMKKGALPLFKKSIETNFNEEEVLQATKAIRVLSFAKDNKNVIKKDKHLVELLRDLSQHVNKDIANAASGVLWNIKEDKEKHVKVDSGQVNYKGHVMISYDWSYQKKLKHIYKCLKDAGYKVWIDIEDMKGSTLDAMSGAVENAAVVLMCISERYRDSANCRAEAEYAFDLKKRIIPLMVQPGYKGNGWLGILRGAKLFVDFSGKYSFDDSFVKLCKQLGEDCKTDHEADMIDAAVIKSTAVQPSRGNGTDTWSTQDVFNWLKKHNLHRNETLKSLTGKELTFLRKLRHEAPEFFFTYVKTDLGLNKLSNLMIFTDAVAALKN